MTREKKRAFVALGSGLLFGVGLALSGMLDPNNVIGFLDVLGDWNPRLMFVMGGAILVHAPIVAWVRRRGVPLLDTKLFLPLPSKRDLDVPLIAGAVMFGIGWGISGYCLGPALVSLPSGKVGVLVFVAGLVFGSWLLHVVQKAGAAAASESA